MSCERWHHVWLGPLIDDVFETAVQAKKHAAWLVFAYKPGDRRWKRVSITLEGEDVPFDDYEFRDGDSRKRKT